MSIRDEAIAFLFTTSYMDEKKYRSIYDALPRPLQYEVSRLRRAEHFKPQNALLKESTEHISPSVKYKLIVVPYKTGNKNWNYTEGTVYKIGSNKPITVVKRNHAPFPFAFIENHPNGHDYLVCGEDHQGQTIIELDTGKRVDYIPDDAYQGAGFCWAAIIPSPSKTLLAIDGCIWGGPYEVVIVDFSDPMSPPFPEIEISGYEDKFYGWVAPETCEFGVEYEARKSDGKPEYALSDEEMEDLDNMEARGTPYSDIWVTERDVIQWSRPSNKDAAYKFIVNKIGMVKKYKTPLKKDVKLMADKLIAKLTDDEWSELMKDEKFSAIIEWFENY